MRAGTLSAVKIWRPPWTQYGQLLYIARHTLFGTHEDLILLIRLEGNVHDNAEAIQATLESEGQVAAWSSLGDRTIG